MNADVTASDRSVATLLATVLSREEPGPVVAAARRRMRQGPEPATSTRAQLIEMVVDVLRQRDAFDQAIDRPPVPRARYYETDHRWEGWRSDDPKPLPTAPGPDRDEVVEALRRLPLPMRAILVVRDAAGLGAEECARITAATVPEQTRLLDQARAAYVAALGDQLKERPT